MSNPLQISVVTQNLWPVWVKPVSGTKSNVPASPPKLRYHFVTALPEEHQKKFDSARDEWMKYAYLEFSETTNPSISNILITWNEHGGASSQVGKQQSGQPTKMSFGGRGCTERNFLHEFGHALGFEHEHQRSDRKDAKIKICEKRDNKSWAENYFDLVDPGTLAAASLRLDKHSIMIYPIGDIELSQELSATDKAFTMLMYPGRKPGDMTINQALNAADIHVAEGYSKEELKKGKIANGIKRCLDNKDYENARNQFIKYNEKVLNRLKVLYEKDKKNKKDMESKKGAPKSKKKSDVETEADLEDDLEDFLSTAVKEAVEWVANNPSDDNDNLESEENSEE